MLNQWLSDSCDITHYVQTGSDAWRKPLMSGSVSGSYPCFLRMVEREVLNPAGQVIRARASLLLDEEVPVEYNCDITVSGSKGARSITMRVVGLSYDTIEYGKVVYLV